MLRRVALVRTDVSEERKASIIRVKRIGELGTTLAVTSKPTHAACMTETRHYAGTELYVKLIYFEYLIRSRYNPV
jgi:hypothetical protein